MVKLLHCGGEFFFLAFLVISNTAFVLFFFFLRQNGTPHSGLVNWYFEDEEMGTGRRIHLTKIVQLVNGDLLCSILLMTLASPSFPLAFLFFSFDIVYILFLKK